MKLSKARVRSYRSVRDTGQFDVESAKTILVGPNEAGKTAVLQALQQINPPEGVAGFDALRDYPRAIYNDITSDKVKPANITIAEAEFSLEDEDKELIPKGYWNCTYTFGRKLDNNGWHRLNNTPPVPTFGGLKKDLLRLSAHIDARVAEGHPPPSNELSELTEKWADETEIRGERTKSLKAWLEKAVPLVDETKSSEEKRVDRLLGEVAKAEEHASVLTALRKRLPVFVLYSNYFRVRPTIHLGHLADRLKTGVLDDEQYDYGNQCLLKLLGFTARQLSDLGNATEPDPNDAGALKAYRDQLDRRSYQLNAASVKLTNEIKSIWLPDPDKDEADRLRIVADGQYLKVVVEDELGVEVELDQRSEGFQWLVSFFVVFFAEAAGQNENAILLLDEPGLSLHGLKQREFRGTVSRLAESNQTLYTTHSPFLVGPDELDMVRVVEMTDRNVGTKIHTSVTADDPAAMLPLQEALGYDLAQSLFAQQRNLILEGLTDYWYVEGVTELMADAGTANLNSKIALVPASSAGKVVYFATILHAHNLKVAALLDSDAAGEQAAKQEVLVHKLGNSRIIRTKDFHTGTVAKPEIEDLLRETLVEVAKADLGWDVSAKAAAQTNRPIIDVFEDEIADFSKYKLAKAFLRWSRTHEAGDLTSEERDQWSALIEKINKALK